MLLRFKFNFEILNKDLAVGIIRTNNPGTSTGFAAKTQKDGINNSTRVSKVIKYQNNRLLIRLRLKSANKADEEKEIQPGWTINTGFRASFWRKDHSIFLTDVENFRYFFIVQRYKHRLAKYR